MLSQQSVHPQKLFPSTRGTQWGRIHSSWFQNRQRTKPSWSAVFVDREAHVFTKPYHNKMQRRVELQNGCLAGETQNLFILSTLNTIPFSDAGTFSEEKHQQNLSSTIDQYISRLTRRFVWKFSFTFFTRAPRHNHFAREERSFRGSWVELKRTRRSWEIMTLYNTLQNLQRSLESKDR